MNALALEETLRVRQMMHLEISSLVYTLLCCWLISEVGFVESSTMSRDVNIGVIARHADTWKPPSPHQALTRGFAQAGAFL